MQLKTIIKVDLTNVSREEQQKLRDYLEDNYWNWRETEEEQKIGFYH